MRYAIAVVGLMAATAPVLAAPPQPITPPAPQSQSRQFNSGANQNEAYMCSAGHLQSALAIAPGGVLLNIDLLDGQGKVIPFGTWGAAQGFKLSPGTTISARLFMTCGN